MVHIILDTNFLLIPAQFGVDIFAEIGRVCDAYTLWIIDRTAEELQAIAQQKGGDGAAAKVALALLSSHAIQQLPAEGKGVDAAILEHAKRGWVVATQDSALRAQLQRRNVKLLIMKGKSHLAIEG